VRIGPDERDRRRPAPCVTSGCFVRSGACTRTLTASMASSRSGTNSITSWASRSLAAPVERLMLKHGIAGCLNGKVQLTNRLGQTTVAFVGRALEFFEGAGIAVSRILTDNGANYRSHLFCDHLLDRGIAVLKTRPYPLRPTARPRPSSRSSRTSGLRVRIPEQYGTGRRARPVHEILQSGSSTRAESAAAHRFHGLTDNNVRGNYS